MARPNYDYNDSRCVDNCKNYFQEIFVSDWYIIF